MLLLGLMGVAHALEIDGFGWDTEAPDAAAGELLEVTPAEDLELLGVTLGRPRLTVSYFDGLPLRVLFLVPPNAEAALMDALLQVDGVKAVQTTDAGPDFGPGCVIGVGGDAETQVSFSQMCSRQALRVELVHARRLETCRRTRSREFCLPDPDAPPVMASSLASILERSRSAQADVLPSMLRNRDPAHDARSKELALGAAREACLLELFAKRKRCLQEQLERHALLEAKGSCRTLSQVQDECIQLQYAHIREAWGLEPAER